MTMSATSLPLRKARAKGERLGRESDEIEKGDGVSEKNGKEGTEKEEKKKWERETARKIQRKKGEETVERERERERGNYVFYVQGPRAPTM